MRTLLPLPRSTRGATLAEGVMVIFIGGMLLSVLPGFYLNYIRVWQRETGRMGAVQRADFALRRMHDDVRSARRVDLSSDGATLNLILPMRAYDADLGRQVNILDSAGQLTDGATIRYHFVQDPHSTGSTGGALRRRVYPAGGGEGPDRLIADQIYPLLNPRGEGGSDPAPIFAYNGTTRVIAITLTAAEPKPSSGTFLPSQLEPKCRRCGADLVRVPTAEDVDGEIQCLECGSEVIPTAELVTYQTRLMLRNE